MTFKFFPFFGYLQSLFPFPIVQDTVFCKSILNEYATKMNLEKPTYTTRSTIQPKGLLPVFISSLVFNGVNYTGEVGRNKKEAEQLAARAVILSIFGNHFFIHICKFTDQSSKNSWRIILCLYFSS